MTPIAAKAGTCSAMRPWAGAAGLTAFMSAAVRIGFERFGPKPPPSSQRPNGVVGQLDSDEEGERENEGVEPVGRHPPDHPDPGEGRDYGDRNKPRGYDEVIAAELAKQRIGWKLEQVDSGEKYRRGAGEYPRLKILRHDI